MAAAGPQIDATAVSEKPKPVKWEYHTAINIAKEQINAIFTKYITDNEDNKTWSGSWVAQAKEEQRKFNEKQFKNIDDLKNYVDINAEVFIVATKALLAKLPFSPIQSSSHLRQQLKDTIKSWPTYESLLEKEVQKVVALEAQLAQLTMQPVINEAKPEEASLMQGQAEHEPAKAEQIVVVQNDGKAEKASQQEIVKLTRQIAAKDDEIAQLKRDLQAVHDSNKANTIVFGQQLADKTTEIVHAKHMNNGFQSLLGEKNNALMAMQAELNQSRKMVQDLQAKESNSQSQPSWASVIQEHARSLLVAAPQPHAAPQQSMANAQPPLIAAPQQSMVPQQLIAAPQQPMARPQLPPSQLEKYVKGSQPPPGYHGNVRSRPPGYRS